jgi:non-ribosomal peptide synthetase component F
VLVAELPALYQALAAGQPSPLPALPIQYGDFAHWQRRWLRGDVMETLAAYWRQRLAGAPPLLDLPFDRPRPELPSLRGAMRILVLGPDLCRDLQVVARRHGATLFMTLLAGFKALLHVYSGQEDIVVGSNIAGRNRAEIEGLIGFFVNMLVLRTDLSGDPTFRELLGRVREVALGAYTHQDMPFERLVDELHIERGRHSPLFQAIFTVQSAAPSEPIVSDLSIGAFALDVETSPYDLIVNLSEIAGEVRGVVQYSRDLFESATIDRLAERYEALLRVIAAHPEIHLSDLGQVLSGAAAAQEEGDRSGQGPGLVLDRALKAARRQPVDLG